MVLLGANVYVRRPSTSPQVEDPASLELASEVTNPVETPPPAKPRSEALSRTVRPSPFEWAPIESSDYVEYIGNLRHLGFPEELVREIIVSDVNGLYASREEALKPKPVPQDAPLSRRRSKPTPEDIERMMQLRDVQIEKHAILQELLGVRIPREMIRTPNSRNWEAYEYAISLLPAEKQEAVQLIQENLWIQDDWNQAQGPDYLSGDAGELAAYRQAAEERNAALMGILTPEEYELYERNSTPTGTELARRVIGMDPTEEEMAMMYKLTDEYWQKTGAVHGRWRALAVPPDQIAIAEEELNAGLRQALGPERYVDYEMATSDMGQRMNSLSLRYQIPRETIREVFAIQSQLDELAAFTRQGGSQTDSAAPSRQGELERQMQDILGWSVWEAWLDGRHQQYDAAP